MFNRFIFRKNYKRRVGARNWTKNTLLRRIFEEINDSGISTNENLNSWSINEDAALSFEFGSSNYSHNNTIELICSLTFDLKNSSFTWETLFNVCKQVYGEKYRCLTIYKDEDFSGSNIERECREVYAPLIKLLQENTSLSAMMRGEPVALSGKMVALREVSDLLTLPVT